MNNSRRGYAQWRRDAAADGRNLFIWSKNDKSGILSARSSNWKLVAKLKHVG